MIQPREQHSQQSTTPTSSTKWAVVSLIILAVAVILGIFSSLSFITEAISSHRRSLRATTTPASDGSTNGRPLRGLYFGTSRTWGYGYQDHDLKDSLYPWLVSSLYASQSNSSSNGQYRDVIEAPTTTNLAIRETGPQYSAMCLKSRLGDDARYDFVVLEYNHYTVRGIEGVHLRILANRIKIRFPDATLIFLFVPLPANLLHVSTFKTLPEIIHDQELLLKQEEHYSISNDENNEGADITWKILERVTQGTTNTSWQLLQPREQANHVQAAARDTDGEVWSPIHSITDKNNQAEQPTTMLDIEQVKNLGAYYMQDANHYSRWGHAQIAKAIVDILQERNVTRSDRVEPWDFYDQCHSWFRTGNMDLEYSKDAATGAPIGMQFFKWPAAAKSNKNRMAMLDGYHCLEVSTTQPFGWIKVNNPTQKQLNLFIYYMVLHDEIRNQAEEDEEEVVTSISTERKARTTQKALRPKQYPSMTVYVSSTSELHKGEVELIKMIHPRVTINVEHPHVHIIKGKSIGPIGPGDHYIHFRPTKKTLSMTNSTDNHLIMNQVGDKQQQQQEQQRSKYLPFRITGIATTELATAADEMEGYFEE